MAQPSPPPPTLEYRTPRGGSPSPHRPKAVRHALGNGVGCVALSLPLGAAASIAIGSFLRNPLVFNVIWTTAALTLNALAYLGCGILYIIVSGKIRQPDALWEKTFLVTCAVHIGIVLLTLLAFYTLDARNRNLEAPVIISFSINILAIFVLGHMFILALYTRLRCQ